MNYDYIANTVKVLMVNLMAILLEEFYLLY